MQGHKHFRRPIATIAGVLALVIGGFLLWYFEIVPPPELGPPPSWHGITPGQTTLDEAFEILGYPDEFDYREGYRVYDYHFAEDERWGWEYVELWVEERNNVLTVSVVIIAVPMPYDSQPLIEFVRLYGQPDEVTWSAARLERVLIWARRGVSVQANGNTRRFGWSQLYVSGVLYCEPMGLRQHLRTRFEWPRRSIGPVISAHRFGPFVIARNRYTDPHMLDDLPQDPYEWENMPIPAAWEKTPHD